MEFNEVVDKILTELYNQTSVAVADELSTHYDLEYKDIYRVVDVLELEGLATKHNNGVTMKITEKGRTVVDNGGFIVYLEEKEKEVGRIKDDQLLQRTLAISNIEANELNIKNAKYIRTERMINISVGIVNLAMAVLNVWLLVKK